MNQIEFNELTRDDLEKLKFVLDSSGDVAIRIIGSSGATNFTGLSDTPSALVGEGGKIVQVNSAGTLIEFGLTLETAVPSGALFTDTTYSVGDGGLTEINFTTAKDTLLSGAEQVSNKNTNNGYAGLDAGGKINPLQLPALAISETFVVASEVAQLALTVQEGDVAVRTDINESYIALNDTNATMADWQKLLTPTGAVTSVAGKSGVVVLDSSDVGLGNVENTALSTWGGSGNITTLGTITSGTWNGTTIAIVNGGTGSTTKNFVDLTTGQSIAGVKTFSASPIIPAPTTDLQASTKKYVDDQRQTGTTLPDATLNTNLQYFKTDEDILYYSNGTAWIALN